MIYYIADSHFGHEGIINRYERPFIDVVDMNDNMIACWNGRVSDNDTVYILGDMFVHSEPKMIKSILKHLNGSKHLVTGNHDASWLAKLDVNKYFESVSDILKIHDGTRDCILCHYPLFTGNNKLYMIFGHIHDNTNVAFWPLVEGQDNMLNACVEVNHYAPATLDELIVNNRLIKNIHSNNKTVLNYRGYTGSVEVSLVNRHLFGRVLNVGDLVCYEAETVNDIEREFCHAVDVYLDCLGDESSWQDEVIEEVLKMQQKKTKNFFEEEDSSVYS